MLLRENILRGIKIVNFSCIFYTAFDFVNTIINAKW